MCECPCHLPGGGPGGIPGAIYLCDQCCNGGPAANIARRVTELRACLDTLTDRAEASGAITGDEADEYRKVIR
jgi:hypothetical protein